MATASSIFLAYRRTDDPDTVQIIGHIADRLSRHFGTGAVVDGTTIAQPGTDLVQTIEALMPQQSVLLVPIGPHSLDPVAPTGLLPLHSPTDPVRLQIEAALRQHIPIIPLLVGRAATPPTPAQLPPSLASLATLPNMPVREEPDFTGDLAELTTTLGRWVRPRPVTTLATAGRSARRYGLLYGGILIPAEILVWVIYGLVSSAADGGQPQTISGGSANQYLGGIAAAIFLVVMPLLAFFLAGLSAARRTGLARTGTVAGIIAASVTGGAGALLAAALLIGVAVGYNSHPAGGFGAGLGEALGLAISFALAIVGLAWLLANLGLGAAFGAIGGAFGRRGYHGLASK